MKPWAWLVAVFFLLGAAVAGLGLWAVQMQRAAEAMARQTAAAAAAQSARAEAETARAEAEGAREEKEQTSPAKEGAMAQAKLEVRSAAFGAGEMIPARFTGDGDDVSPALSWSGAPAGTKELALIMDDPDAPSAEPWVHWVMYKIPAGTDRLPEGVPARAQLEKPVAAAQGKNSWGGVGYRGPAPPKGHGTHHYHFKVYALDAPLELGPGADKGALLKAMSGHVVAEGEVVGTYRR